VAKHKKAESKINTEGWMMSYADMATILLAMFIVLSTFGKDQTGATLQKGLESWRESRQFFGLPGFLTGSSQVSQHHSPGPSYSLDHEASGENGDRPSSLTDGETERFQNFLQELERHFEVRTLPRAAGRATVDLFDPLHAQAPLLSAKQFATCGQILPLLRRPEYRVTLVVWATMPVESALTRAADQAYRISEELRATALVPADAWKRFDAVCQCWRYPHHQRPVMSLMITKSETAPNREPLR